MNSRDIALFTVISALYVALGFGLQNIAFGTIQIRVADALYPLIAILGLPCLVGTFYGHFIFNFYGFGVGIALGVGDLLSPFIFLIPKLLIWKFGLKAVPIHVLFVAIWVSYLLNVMFAVPFLLSLVLVGIGEFIAEIVLGVPLTLGIKRRLMKK